MNELVLMPAVQENRSRFDFADAEVVEPIAEVNTKQSSVSFLDANTNAVTLEELSTSCVVPTWGNQELTISHQDFISCVHNAASDFYKGETLNSPEIRVSHIVRGRTPDALGKKASELLESEKTQFYHCFCFHYPNHL